MTAKKATPNSRSTKKDASAAPNKKAAEAQVKALIAEYSPTHQRLIAAVRRSLRNRLPTAYEVVYAYQNQNAMVISYSPSEHGYEGVLGLRADTSGVKLYFTQGKQLPDPKKLLQGKANARWLLVDRATTLADPAVVQLMQAALAGNRMPFAKTGRGAVVMRSSGGK